MFSLRLHSLQQVGRSWAKAAACGDVASRPTAGVLAQRLYSSAHIGEHTNVDVSAFIVRQGMGRSNHGRLINTNWTTLEDQPLTGKSVKDLIQNVIPAIRHKSFLSADECSKLVHIVQQHQIGSYDQRVVFPPLGSIGLTQFDHQQDKEAYLNRVEEANSLQRRFKDEANVDILGRVAGLLQEATGLETRVAREGDRTYFAGLLRAVNDYIQIHSDYAPYDGAGWEIGKITSQLTWNILLRQVPGGDTIIYDRQWQGAADDKSFRKAFPRYAYEPAGVQGSIFKAMAPIEGDLTFFNSRNFHEVKPCDKAWDRPEDVVRYTMSSFVGYLPAPSKGAPPSLILWS
ncbi:hypothetical protein HD806DRAFT_514017 [Xylariaceae sp. AK1471]|nr:hypothetical protein HD806DRAFT_514017 [Xylariaceae sp. AK1471]